MNTYEVWGYCHADDGSWVEKPVLKNMTFRKLSGGEKTDLQENEGQNWIDHHKEQEDLYDTLATLKKGTEGYEEVLEKLYSETSAYTNCHEEVGWGTEL